MIHRLTAIAGAAAIALGAGAIVPNSFGFAGAAVAVLGFWRLLDAAAEML